MRAWGAAVNSCAIRTTGLGAQRQGAVRHLEARQSREIAHAEQREAHLRCADRCADVGDGDVPDGDAMQADGRPPHETVRRAVGTLVVQTVKVEAPIAPRLVGSG